MPRVWFGHEFIKTHPCTFQKPVKHTFQCIGPVLSLSNPYADLPPLYVHDIVDYNWDWENEWAGPEGPPPPPYNPPIDELVRVEERHPTFEDYRREIFRSQDVLIWLWPPGGGFGHIVTGVGWRKDPATGKWQVCISDPWNPGVGPDNNNDPTLKNYHYYDVLDELLQLNGASDV